ncbi:securin-like [Arapaima gigas]
MILNRSPTEVLWKAVVVPISSVVPNMATLIYVDQENGSIRTPAPSKQRARLQSAPGTLYADKCLKTPLSGNPLRSGRKALGAVNKICSAVSSSAQENKKRLATATQAKTKQPKIAEQYPEVENFIPYNPLDFENFEVPEEVRLSHVCLAGLGSVSLTPAVIEEDELEELKSWPETSPVKIRSGKMGTPLVLVSTVTVCTPTNLAVSGCSAELDAFLQTVSELTVDLPPEMED